MLISWVFPYLNNLLFYYWFHIFSLQIQYFWQFSVFMFEKTLHSVKTIPFRIKGLTFFRLVLFFFLNYFLIQLLLSMSEFAFISIITLLFFNPILAHFRFEFSLVYHCFFTSCIIFLIKYLTVTCISWSCFIFCTSHYQIIKIIIRNVQTFILTFNTLQRKKITYILLHHLLKTIKLIFFLLQSANHLTFL